MAATLHSRDVVSRPRFARLSLAQYHAMILAGVLSEDDSVELMDGFLVTKMPKSPRHVQVVRRLQRLLASLLPPDWTAIKEDPITLTDPRTTVGSEPEPDIAIVATASLDRPGQHPTADDCLLLVEVAETSVAKDRLRAGVYAAAGVPEYWIANLGLGLFERHSKSVDGVYTRTETLESLSLVVDGRTLGPIRLSELLA